MSIKREIVEVTPPKGIHFKKSELYKFKEQECPECNGNGGHYVGGWQEKFKDDLNSPDWIMCPVCKGTGLLEANVLVSWVSCGEVKEQFK